MSNFQYYHKLPVEICFSLAPVKNMMSIHLSFLIYGKEKKKKKEKKEKEKKTSIYRVCVILKTAILKS